MRWFSCGACGQSVFFENVRCTQCGHVLAFLSDVRKVGAIEPVPGDPNLFRAVGKGWKQGKTYRLCANSIHFGVCNWAIPAKDPDPLCRACRLNDVVPDPSNADHLAAWAKLELAKRRLLYTLEGLKLPIESRAQRKNGLVFNFKADGPGENEKVFTGHSDGEIVINIAEADDPFREKLRKQLGENYRTVLGHFRHEIGHYYWDRLVKETALLGPYRALFGDERESYADALTRHYQKGPPADWHLHYISAYATMHPWEDWAETWAHYLHMVDTLESAAGLGLVVQPRPIEGKTLSPLAMSKVNRGNFDSLLEAWIPLTLSMNTLNRSMGLIDGYPFVLTATVIEKLRFVHDVIQQASQRSVMQERIARWWRDELGARPTSPEPLGLQTSPA